MSTTKARAIVIKEKSIGESNKSLTLFAKDIGKITVTARGAKKQKSKFLHGAQAFCYCDFVLYRGGGFLSVNQIDLIRNFAADYDDIFKLSYGAYFLELIDRTVMFEQEANDIMLLLLKALQRLEKSSNPKKISAAFQIKLFDMLGFTPDTTHCAVCGREIPNGCLYFSRINQFVCDYCVDATAFQTSESVTEPIRYVCAQQSLSRIFLFRLNPRVLDELHRILESIAQSQLEVRGYSLELIKNF